MVKQNNLVKLHDHFGEAKQNMFVVDLPLKHTPCYSAELQQNNNKVVVLWLKNMVHREERAHPTSFNRTVALKLHKPITSKYRFLVVFFFVGGHGTCS